MELDENGMIPLPNHMDFEKMLRPRRPTEDGFLDTYPPWVIVSFSAKWCGPCKTIDKKALVAATPGVKWYSVDVDVNDTTLGYCGLRSIPAFCIIRDGHFLDRRSGAASVPALLQWLAEKGVPVQPV